MKKKYAWPLVLALITMGLTSCDQQVEVEPEPPVPVHGQYHAVYASPSEDMPHTDINLDVKQVTDSTYQAQMAFYHYYKDNLLFSEVTEKCEPVINNDTILLDFVIYEGKKTSTTTQPKRSLNVMLRYDEEALKLLSTSDNSTLPDGLLFRKAITHEDSTALRFDARLPKVTMVDGMYLINGPIKRFSASTSKNAKGFEYYFNENGVVTGYKDIYGKTYEYEVGEIGEGVYYSLLVRNGWKTELSYNASQQLVSENTRRNLISYYYDDYGRLMEGYFKNFSTYYSFGLECDNHGTLVGIRNKSADRYTMKFIVQETDHYGNPLEQGIDYGNGRAVPCYCEYEYYE